MARCAECIDINLPAELLTERCSVTFSPGELSSEVVIAIFHCPHGRTRRHAIYPGTRDWSWMMRMKGARLSAAD